MKPTSKSDATVIQPPSTGKSAVPSVTDELGAIDVAPLRTLLEIRKEQTRIDDFRHRADDLKDKAKDAVRKRVLDDYGKRWSALESQATPLTAQVKTEYQKVRALLERVTGVRDAAALEKEELEFRHAVGELSEAQLADALKKPAGVLERCATDLAAVETQKAAFVEALGADAALAPPPAAPAQVAAPPAAPVAAPQPAPVVAPPIPVAPPPAAKPVPPPAVASGPLRADATTVMSPDVAGLVMPDLAHITPRPMRKVEPPPSGPLASPPSAHGGSIDETSAMPSLARASKPPSSPPASSPDATRVIDPTSEAQTFLLPAAALIITSPDGAPVEHRLAALNHLGRSEDNQIQVVTPGVSRRHALVVATSNGFMVKDLQSQNGTFVNGSKISEHSLVDGDRLSIGDTQFVYRTPWPK